MPAGHGIGSNGGGGGGFLDDDEDMVMAERNAAFGAGKNRRGKAASKGGKRRMGDFWTEVKRSFKRGPKVYEGERKIWLNNPPLNEPSKFCNNYVSTSKYNVVTFVPKFFLG